MARLGRTATEGSVSGVLGDLPIALLLVVGVCAPVTGWFATRRFRSPAVWFLLGALTGPLATILLAVAPPGRCPVCDAKVVGWPSWCARCHARLRDGASEAGMGTSRAVAVPVRAEPVPVSVGPALAGHPSTTSILERASLVAPPTSIDAARPGGRRDTRSPDGRSTRTRAAGAAALHSVAAPTITASNHQLATGPTEVTTGDVLSTGVYISGNAGLEIGACYAIARKDERLRIFGPVDAGQLTIRHEGPLTDFDVTAMDDRVIIAGREGLSSVAIVLRTIGGMRAEELEAALSPSIAGFGGRG
jgi:hypothetical protein